MRRIDKILNGSQGQPLKENEYINKTDGLFIVPNGNTPKQMKIEILSKQLTVPGDVQVQKY